MTDPFANGVALLRLAIVDDTDGFSMLLDDVGQRSSALISAVLAAARLMRESSDAKVILEKLERIALVYAHDAIVDQ